jgi:soluble lytic murein transglycosylase-like protein
VSERTASWLIATGAAAFWAASGAAADIYRSETPDGSVRNASQALDASYSLYLTGTPPPIPVPVVQARPAAKRQAQLQARLAPLIERLADRHGMEAALVQAVIEIESGFDPMAISRKGAAGAMQLMPATAARYGVTRPTDPAQNIDAGIRHLKYLLALHNGNVALALASYNAGEGAVARHGGRIPPNKETMLYVPAVLARLQAARRSRNT